MLRRALPWLLCVPLLAACPGNILEDFSGRELRFQILPTPKAGAERFRLQVELVRLAPEVGCLRLRKGVEVLLNGVPLQVFEGSQTPDPDGPCGSPEPIPPTFSVLLEAKAFTGEPRNAVLEIRDGDERIVGEFQNFFARHTLVQLQPPQVMRPGQEVFLAWEPATDDLSIIETVAFFTEGSEKAISVPVKPEAGGLRVTLPADLPPGKAFLVARAANIPALRCEGVAKCAAWVPTVNFPYVEVLIQP